jgi:hypothetical protein
MKQVNGRIMGILINWSNVDEITQLASDDKLISVQTTVCVLGIVRDT